MHPCEWWEKLSPSVDLQDSQGTTALMAAAASGHEGILQVLLEAGADAHLRDDRGRTVVEAALWNRDAILRQLQCARMRQ